MIAIRLAKVEDLPRYVELATIAQQWLQSKGLAQYVPAAHETYATAIRERVDHQTLFCLCENDQPIAFFSLDSTKSIWWPDDQQPAKYLAGMVIDFQQRGRNLGKTIIDWASNHARESACRYLRLDCHAGNPWLCRYYESHGFEFVGRIEQAPGYDGCLYQLSLMR